MSDIYIDLSHPGILDRSGKASTRIARSNLALGNATRRETVGRLDRELHLYANPSALSTTLCPLTAVAPGRALAPPAYIATLRRPMSLTYRLS